MKAYNVSQKTIPLDDSWDVIVIGGGPAGCAAAYSAAREGARTLLIEATGCLGGMSTAGMVPGWCGFSDKEKFIHEGFAAKIRVALYTEEQNKPDKWLSIDFEHLKRVYDELMTSVGVTVLYHTMLGGIEMKSEHTIDTILTVNKDGLTAKKAEIYIDCTGDGDAAAWAGAPFEKGDAQGDVMPVSHCFAITNVNEQVFDGPKYEDWTQRAIADETLPLIKDGFFGRGTSLGKGIFAYNAGHIWDIDASDAQSLSKGLIDGRKLAAQLHEALKRYYVNGFDDSFLTATGSLLGVRETRRIIGDYVLTKEDHQARRSFPDEIARSSFFIDIHASKEEVQEQQRGNPVVQLRKKRTSFGPGESHGIPYRCLTPKGLTNCIVAGRTISCDRETFGAIRIMPACFSMGEAAGIAAVIAQNSTSVDVHAIDVQKLRSRLREVGAYLP